MAKYFIDTSDEDFFVRDTEGRDFPDLDAVKRAAVDALPDMAREKLPDGDSRSFLAMVRGGDGELLLQATLTLKIMSLVPSEER